MRLGSCPWADGPGGGGESLQVRGSPGTLGTAAAGSLRAAPALALSPADLDAIEALVAGKHLGGRRGGLFLLRPWSFLQVTDSRSSLRLALGTQLCDD